jgi:hypothetical protein
MALRHLKVLEDAKDQKYQNTKPKVLRQIIQNARYNKSKEDANIYASNLEINTPNIIIYKL